MACWWREMCKAKRDPPLISLNWCDGPSDGTVPYSMSKKPTHRLESTVSSEV